MIRKSYAARARRFLHRKKKKALSFSGSLVCIVQMIGPGVTYQPNSGDVYCLNRGRGGGLITTTRAIQYTRPKTDVNLRKLDVKNIVVHPLVIIIHTTLRRIFFIRPIILSIKILR